MNHWKYAELWGAPKTTQVTLGEGGTPLIRSTKLAAELGLRELWFKYEGANPTGSYKDRFASSAISHLQQDGKKICLGTSSGNTGAAVAAYCARAGMSCHLAIVEGAPEGKLRQMLAYGARLVRIRNFGTSPAISAQVMNGLRGLAAELDAGLEISAFAFSPRGMAGVMTISFELAEILGPKEMHVFTPAGAGGLTLAVARGFETLATRQGWAGRAHVHCVQPAGNDTIAAPLREGKNEARAVESKTAISGLQVGGIIDAHDTVAACRRSGGQGHVVTDDEAWSWQARLAKEEGVFCEPAGAVALAGVAGAVRRGELDKNVPVVCLVTGSGFKDERSLVKMIGTEGAPLVDDFAAFSAQVRSAAK
ncbi:MAG: thrC 1 [Verrucomicrobia bacterium]|nr:thrC 1 [Verrucomicrobiota bacterium]